MLFSVRRFKSLASKMASKMASRLEIFTINWIDTYNMKAVLSVREV